MTRNRRARSSTGTYHDGEKTKHFFEDDRYSRFGEVSWLAYVNNNGACSFGRAGTHQAAPAIGLGYLCCGESFLFPAKGLKFDTLTPSSFSGGKAASRCFFSAFESRKGHLLLVPHDSLHSCESSNRLITRGKIVDGPAIESILLRSVNDDDITIRAELDEGRTR